MACAARPWRCAWPSPRSQYGENSEALYLTSGYVQPTAEASARRFAGDEDGFTYGRYGNPTVTSFEQRLAALEEAPACISAASGMSAILMMCLGLLKAGDHVLCSRSMFGSTIKLIGSDLAKFGVESSFVSQTDVAEWKVAVRPNTKLLFAETPTNPLTEVCDIRALADLAHNAGALLAVDNCFATPALQRPMAMGADIVMHSGTKYLDGQGRVMAGALCASEELVEKSFLPILKSGGMTLAPFNAWVVLKGLETLELRMRAQSAQALALARWLEAIRRWRVCSTLVCPATRSTNWQWPSRPGWVARCSRSKSGLPTPARPVRALFTCWIRCRCCHSQPTSAIPRPCVPTRPAHRMAA